MQRSIEQLRDVASAVARDADYRLVVLYGSGARGERNPGDLDIGIESASAELDAIDAAVRFARALETDAVDIADLRRANPVLLMSVARDGIPLYEATGSEFAAFSSLAMRRYADTKKFRDAVRDDLREYARKHSAEHHE